MSDMPLFEGQDDRDILSVSELTHRIKRSLERQFSSQWLRGEIAEVSRPRSGHIYLTIKDNEAQIRAVIWRTNQFRFKAEIEEGQEVICRGDLDLYPPRGSYQMVLQSVELVGEGALRTRLRKLQDKLAQQGLFDSDRKKPIPRFPRFIAVVTSPSGAAIRDFLEVSRRRWKGIRVMIIPARVQGTGAANQIARGIRAAARLQIRPDVVVVARGGGSLEDLWCFNEEPVVRAVAECDVPLVSAVGHEVDVTLCDLAADLRALTPTEAAERILPSRDIVADELSNFARRLRQIARRRIDDGRTRLEAISARRVLQHPLEPFHQLERKLDQIDSRISLAIANHAHRASAKLSNIADRLDALSPLSVLARGYSLTTTDQGQIVQASNQVQKDDRIVTRLQKGQLVSRVEQVIEDSE